MSVNGFEVIGISSSGKELHDVEQVENVRVLVLEMTRTISPFKDIKSFWEFYRLCRIERPTIVHSHTPKAGFVCMLGAKLAGVPIRMHTVAGLPLMEVTGMKRIILNLVEKITYRCATRVYPNSKGLCDFILEHRFISSDKLKVIGQGSSNGIDTNFFNPRHFGADQLESLRNALGIESTDFVFIFVGRLVGDKGINELVKSFLMVCEQAQANCHSFSRTNYKLLLVGSLECELDALHQRTIEVIDQSPNIITVGFQEDVRPYFAISDALVFPSYREGFPNVVMQAGSMGLPSIVTDINGCNEIIIEGKNGLIIPVKDTEALQKAMLKLIEDQVLHEQLKSNAHAMITSRYEQKVVWEALLEEYNQLLEKI